MFTVLIALALGQIEFLTIGDENADYMNSMLAYNNYMRACGKLPAHILNKELCHAAQHQAYVMAKYRRFYHAADGLDSMQRAIRYGYTGDFFSVREIIAKNAKWPNGKLAFENPWESWRSSPSHYGAKIGNLPDRGEGWERER